MPKKSSYKLLKALLALFLLATVAVGGWLWQRYEGFADTPLALAGSERILTVERGDGFTDILGKLRELGVDEGHDLEWKLLAQEMGVLSRLQVGDYSIRHGITPSQLLRKLERGDVIHYRFTIVEGWNLRELRAALAADERVVQTLHELDDAALMKALGRDGLHPEGRFLPETYHYTRGMSDVDLLRRAMLAMDKALAEAWEGREEGLPIETPDELLTLASIIEKETGKASERPEIAGVFVRRLRLGMRLQTDPTVIYGMGSAYDGNIRRRDLTTDTPYNTYTRGGLPPTPIAMPGRAALEAAARPLPGNTLYFVSRGDGSHVFSASLAEHNRAVACHQLKRCR
ncbi:endolytic transglycosylase MltG [Arenimonas caeni]|uniref:endolytic transglycosylase MltG n=1 Tax=Arenimonas caeni TaxID=2058085 RepID=UPI002A35F87B|nr:endolytic transglycosylase MltG [Arenimonas caeni]MDY0021319.1 endolytic transglycosylase MltG [Arenimonas caeni]